MTDSRPNGGKLSKILSELKVEYRNGFPQKVEKLKFLHAQNDWVTLTREFHKLKGTGRTYGYPEVSLICEVLEAYCATGNVDAAQIEKVFGVFQRMHDAWIEDQFFHPQQDPEASQLMTLKPVT